MDSILRIVDLFGLRPILVALMVFVPLERVLALHREQTIFRRGVITDFCYVLFNGVTGNFFASIMLVVAFSAASIFVPVGLLQRVIAQPIWVQVIEIIVITDLGVYAAHRMFHTVPFLWRFHMIHHSVEEMDCMAAFHVHPVDQFITKAMALLPVFFLGFSDNAILIYYAIYLWHAMLIHANVRLTFGPLRWLIATPQFHHWHHADERKAYDKNFAGQLAIIDLILGTYRLPRTSMPEKYGVKEGVPTSFFGQIGFPFARRKSRRPQSVGN
ncbi:sterol desaturase family protein [bacterium M00.F.Ca.ET.159.01.1.1]|nr:sterol desaturase family protein [bacterium M00.F.Ca.ET.159.01.1.1]